MTAVLTMLPAFIGGIFGILTRWMDLKVEKVKIEERREERTHELAVMDKEAEHAEKKLKIEQEIEQMRAAGEAFTASQKYGNERILPDGIKLTKAQAWWLVLAEAFGKFIRPLSTIYYQLAMAVVFAWSAWTLAETGSLGLEPKTAAEIVKETIYAILYMAEMTLGWWFGISVSRAKR